MKFLAFIAFSFYCSLVNGQINKPVITYPPINLPSLTTQEYKCVSVTLPKYGLILSGGCANQLSGTNYIQNLQIVNIITSSISYVNITSNVITGQLFLFALQNKGLVWLRINNQYSYIFDVNTNSLSRMEDNVDNVVSVEKYNLFVFTSDTGIKVYNADTGGVTFYSLSFYPSRLTSIENSNKLIAYNDFYLDTKNNIAIFDLISKNVVYNQISPTRYNMNVKSIDSLNITIFTGGNYYPGNTIINSIDILDFNSNNWTSFSLSNLALPTFFKINIYYLEYQNSLLFGYNPTSIETLASTDKFYLYDLNKKNLINISLPVQFVTTDYFLYPISLKDDALIFFSIYGGNTAYYSLNKKSWISLNNLFASVPTVSRINNTVYFFDYYIKNRIYIFNFTNATSYQMTSFKTTSSYSSIYNPIINYQNNQNGFGLVLAIDNFLNNFVVFSNCPNGTYAYGPDQKCIPCPGGYYCSAYNITPSICSPGYYCPFGTLKQLECPIGYFSLPGTGNSFTKNCFLCPANFYCPNNPKLLAACPLGTSYYNGQLYIDPQPDNYQSLFANPIINVGYNSSSQCGSCPAGTYGKYVQFDLIPRDILDINYDFAVCVSCTVGNYCPSKSAYPIPCPQGTYNDIIGTTNISYCKNCPIGTFNPNFGVGTIDRCFACTSGKYCPSGTAIPSDCPSNYYCPNPSEKISCPAGTYFDGSGAITVTSCIPCSPGNYCPGSGNGQIQCDSGSFSNNNGAIKCEITPSGYSTSIGSKIPTICPINTYSTKGSSNCLPCPNGEFNDKEGQDSCFKCPSSQFSANGWWCMTSTEKLVFIVLWIGSLISGLATIKKTYEFVNGRYQILKKEGIPFTFKNLIFIENAIEQIKSKEMITLRESVDQPMLSEDEMKQVKETIITLQTEISLLKVK